MQVDEADAEQNPESRKKSRWHRRFRRTAVACVFINGKAKFSASLRFHQNVVSTETALPFFPSSKTFLRAHPRVLTPPRNSNFHAKHSVYEQHGWDVISNITFWPRPRASIWVADPDAVKELTLSRDRFAKPVGMYKLLSFFGGNIVASEGEDWKRHRKIAQPAFSEKNNKLVWDETSRIVKEMIISWGADKDSIEIEQVVNFTLPIALMVIGSAGFGKRVAWNEDLAVPEGHKMSFRTALSVVCKDLFLKIIIPRWASGLTQRYHNIHTAFNDLQVVISKSYRKRTPLDDASHSDLFSNLIRASEAEEESKSLSAEELMGDTFIFLLAGHETTAHTLAFTFALLALYQNEQEQLYQQIRTIIPEGQEPVYEDMHLLTRSMAVFYETLRLFPPVNIIPKVPLEETTLSFSSAIANGEQHGSEIRKQKTVRVPKNARVHIHVPGLHYNPRYWDDPHEFRPSRFLGDWPKEAFLPFSGGPRACIGRRFFETEGIATLSILVSRYRIAIKEDPRFTGESFEMKKERILRCKAGLTLTPVHVPLVFIRRKES
ncbi:cytochrome P450 [Fomitiporia mediterranea MF3/22]|uniref:cytochrome P450 n=1 Tax=Fomitiporia mediterranea (strain MF3/22) TaxID=694068 RepID=UPI00044090CC|nr:cytochrome P450 [Fomitiporia mediterranea MF3/22]EJD03717.1 cytochrome P450 [Fomitiporia mediterranea MF3/22]